MTPDEAIIALCEALTNTLKSLALSTQTSRAEGDHAGGAAPRSSPGVESQDDCPPHGIPRPTRPQDGPLFPNPGTTDERGNLPAPAHGIVRRRGLLQVLP